jgi:tRNA U34 5-methylaminomethyl-2-thiouridine-forming methyltransferase MnmC
VSTLQLVVSEDGSHTLYNPLIDETYHSTRGAIQESKHVFINEGLTYWSKINPQKGIKVLEIGMGTGLNVWLTAIWAFENKIKVDFLALEPFPIQQDLVEKLNFTQMTSMLGLDAFQKIHQSNWEVEVHLHPYFSLKKSKKGILEAHVQPVDVIYFDAFAPSKVPAMWELPVFEKVALFASEGTILSTYCAKGQVRRDLTSVGFKVDRIPGPPGKRQMMRALFTKLCPPQ